MIANRSQLNSDGSYVRFRVYIFEECQGAGAKEGWLDLKTTKGPLEFHCQVFGLLIAAQNGFPVQSFWIKLKRTQPQKDYVGIQSIIFIGIIIRDK